VVTTAAYVTTRQLGVLNLVQLPQWAKLFVTVAFMDFMLYIWHLLNHEVPLLWRFHRVHHSDLNMDVSTATRFHIGELAISAIIKISLVFLLGASLMGVLIFESVLVLFAQFHHSSLRVPKWFESVFWMLFVPPSMHRIHHSVILKERNTNYGTIFSTWDRWLGTLLTDVDQSRIRIGIGAYQQPDKLHFHHLLAMPITRPVK
jgi:sterol desaturase/sphingolipid hydroxylase (fatty acid hydroxylase superfamily)